MQVIRVALLFAGAITALPVPSFEILQDADSVCAALGVQLQSADRDQRESAIAWREVWDDATHKIPDWHRANAISEALFDFDNDGRTDRVLHFEYFGFYLKGSVPGGAGAAGEQSGGRRSR